VRRLNVDALLDFGIHLAAKDAAAWKCESVHTIIIDHGHFKVAIERRGGYGLPLHELIICSGRSDALI